MTTPALILLFLHLLDGASTLYGTGAGLREANPLARWVLGRGLYLPYKVGIAGLQVIVFEGVLPWVTLP